MYRILSDVRVIEASSFVASPLAGLYLAQMGAEVVRVDQIGGGPDFARWPKSPSGASFYWEGLNRGKKSVAVNLAVPEGRELLQHLATAPGATNGLLLTNYPATGFLSYEKLKVRRSDIVIVRVMGRPDGRTALDYTINCELGVPFFTGPARLEESEPVNHVLPVWDLVTGTYAAFALLAAERHRSLTEKGGEVRIPLSDMGISTIGNLGTIAEVLHSGANRKRYGNEIFGAFGRDFVTSDEKRLMIVAVTPRQWSALVKVLELEDAISLLEKDLSVSFAKDEGVRFTHRDVLVPLVADKVRQYDSEQLTRALDKAGGCWGLYRTTLDALDDPDLVKQNPVFSEITNLSGVTYPAPGAPATLTNELRESAGTAPRLGQHTEEVLAELLGLSGGEIARLFDSGIIAQPADRR